MAIMLQTLQDWIKGLHPAATVGTMNVLLKGAQVYVGGEVDDDDDDDDEIGRASCRERV